MMRELFPFVSKYAIGKDNILCVPEKQDITKKRQDITKKRQDTSYAKCMVLLKRKFRLLPDLGYYAF